MTTIGDQAKAFREARGLSTTAFAKVIGGTVRRQHIEQLEEAGNRIPKYIGRLAEVMGTSVDQLLATAGLHRPSELPQKPSAEPKGEFLKALSSEDRELISHFQHLLPSAKKALIRDVAKMAKDHKALRDELLTEAGVTAIMEKAASSSRKGATVGRQNEPDDQ